MELPRISNTSLGSRTVSFDDRTTILYALCAGAGPGDLDLVWEERLRPIPTLSTVLGLWAVEAAGNLGAYDRKRSLHVGQRVRMKRSMPADGAIEMHAGVAAVWDKGRAAIVEIAVESEYFDLGYTIFLPGMGGFGGDAGPSSSASEPFEPTLEASVMTDERLALFYRLTGDRHPVHVDPAVAAENGFDRPILHGLCTLVVATRVASTLSGQHPSDLIELDARFAAPVTPGETITVTVVPAADDIRFEAAVADRTVLKGGRARFVVG